MNYPNLFIVGAPKCGTTSLAAYLNAHPDVFICEPKEPHFFATGLPGPHPRKYIRDRTEYLDLFSTAGHYSHRGEASTWYLYANGTAEQINAFSREARIIIMIRHPVDMMFSLYSHRKYSGDEDARTFEEALELESLRRRGDRLPRNMKHTVQGLFYRDVARFADRIRRYVDVFGVQRVHLIDFERFVRDTVGEYERVLKFLEVPMILPVGGFAVFNENKRRYNQFLYTFMDERIPESPKKIFKKVFGAGPARAIKGVFKSVPSLQQETLDPRTAAHLEAACVAEIRDLANVSGLDLSGWFRYGSKRKHAEDSAHFSSLPLL
jgi:hypothetical protein